MELKKATTFEEQIQLLKDKGITISDEFSCATFLSRTVNYISFVMI